MKKLTTILTAPQGHWVGDGFPVRSLFSYQSHGRELSPFLLLDYAGPAGFEPTSKVRGVGEHPHRGIETVTIVYHGEVSHRDSTGSGGHIGPGDVQWMTAASGILHEEFHSRDFAAAGGTLEMVQLWVNLPAQYKKSDPGYQTLMRNEIPIVELPGDSHVRVIAGQYNGHSGPAKTFTPLNVWDAHLSAGATTVFPVNDGHSLALVILQGNVSINDSETASDSEVAIFDHDGSDVSLHSNTESRLLLLSGEPIDEPIVGHGPFVMNTPAEISDAIEDYRHGKFGRMPE